MLDINTVSPASKLKNIPVLIKKFFPKRFSIIFLLLVIVIVLVVLAYYYNKITVFETQIADFVFKQSDLKQKLSSAEAELKEIKSEDQYQTNKKLEEEIKNINQTYKGAVTSFEKILELKDKKVKTDSLDKVFAKILIQLSERNYSSATADLEDLTKQIKSEDEKASSSFKIPENVPVVNASQALPSGGFKRQNVQTDVGNFLVDIISSDLNSTRVIIDTASDSDCSNDCPVLPLGEYVSRSGAFAGINGSYFCPASYPSCAGRTNAYDTLLMNKDKKYFNSDNNVYSTVPAAIFYGNSARFVSQSLEWGRDTGADAVIANHPLLVLNNEVVFGGNDDPKQGSRGSRSFVGATDNTVYIGVVHNATVAEVARVLQAVGIQNALNLDSGGSTALWYGGYKVGPGRNIPNALLLLRK